MGYKRASSSNKQVVKPNLALIREEKAALNYQPVLRQKEFMSVRQPVGVRKKANNTSFEIP